MLETYLDYNATAPLRDEVRAAMLDALDAPANPSSVHGFGQRARFRVEEARAAVGSLAGAGPEEVIFTSGGTEANAMALMRDWPQVFVGSTEHVAVLEAVPHAERLAVDSDGLINLTELDKALAAAPEGSLVSVMAANNETGVIQPLEEIAKIAGKHKACMHSDAVQGLGKINLNFADLGLDLMSLSAHKIGGPTGVGALVQREGVPANPLSRGGGQERNRRPGTENVSGIVGFGAAASMTDPAVFTAHCRPLRDRLESCIKAEVPEAVIIAEDAERLANTTCIAMPGRIAENQVMALDLDGIAVGAGAACSSGKVRISHVLEAMGAADLAGCAIRVSSGWATSPEDIEKLAEALISLYKHS